MDAALVRSIQEAQSILEQIGGSARDHTGSVVEFARELGRHHPAVNADLIEVAAWWHDTGRLHGADHERLSAHMADSSLARLGVAAQDRQIVFEAIEFHKWSMTPQTLPGEIIRDADKLDWVSVSCWRRLLAEGKLERLQATADSLGDIRDEILHLEPSRDIFDRTVRSLAEYLHAAVPPFPDPMTAAVKEFISRAGGSGG